MFSQLFPKEEETQITNLLFKDSKGKISLSLPKLKKILQRYNFGFLEFSDDFAKHMLIYLSESK